MEAGHLDTYPKDPAGSSPRLVRSPIAAGLGPAAVRGRGGSVIGWLNRLGSGVTNAARRFGSRRRDGHAYAQFRRLADDSLSGILIHDGERQLYANPAYARMYGYPDVAAALDSLKSAVTIFPEDLPALRAEWQRIMSGQQSWSQRRYRRRRVDGTLMWIDLRLGPITWDGRPAIQGIQNDVTREVEGAAALQRSEARLRDLLAESLNGIAIHDGRQFLFVNAAFATMFGLPKSGATGSPELFEACYFGEEREYLDQVWRPMLDGTTGWSSERSRRRRADGSIVWCDLMRAPITWMGRQAIQVIAIDVTREVETEAELRRNEARVRAIIDNVPQILTFKDADRRFQLVNRAFERWHGLPHGATLGRTPEEMMRDWPGLTAINEAAVRADEAEVLRTGHPVTRERHRMSPAGEAHDLIVTKFAVRQSAGGIEGVGTVVTDVTALKRAQAQLVLREAELRRNQAAILHLLREKLSGGAIGERIARMMALAGETLGVDGVAIWNVDHDAGVVRCIGRWIAPSVPYPAEQFPRSFPFADARPFYDLLEQKIVLALDDLRVDRQFSSLIDKHFTFCNLTASLASMIQIGDGLRDYLTFAHYGRARAWSVEDQSFARSMAELIGTCLVEAELAERERALRRNQDTLVRVVREGLLTGGTSQRGLNTIVELACTTLGLRRVGVWTVGASAEPSKRTCLAAWDSRLQRHMAPDEMPPVAPDDLGAWLTADYFTQLEHDLLVAIEDIETDPRLTEVGRRYSRGEGVGARMHALICLPDRVLGVVTFLASSARRWTAEDRAFARSVADLVAFAFLSERHRESLAALDLVGQGLYVESAIGEVIYANRLARRLAGAFDDTTPVALDRLPALAHAAAAGDTLGEIGWRTPAGETLDLAIARTTLPSAGAVTVIADVTERKLREREHRELEAEMRQAAKLEAVGRLAGGIAHDFNNLLGTILGFSSFLLEDLSPDSAQHGYAARITKASEHAKEVVKQLLAFTRASDVERRIIDLRALVADSTELLRAALPSSTALAVDTGRDALPASVNDSQIHQILLNLCINANDALGGQPGRIELALGRVGAAELALPELDGEAAVAINGTPRRDRAYARLAITDNGAGIDAATLTRVFDPFFTTKSPGHGTGLGLAVVHGIVAAYDGIRVVESRLGHGSCFTVYLPLAEHDVADVREADRAERPNGHETVLVVDDEPDLLEMMRVGLTRLGYAVTGYSDPARALEAFAREPDRWDIVVTDQVMPGINGGALIAKLREIRPRCPVILCTGFSDGATERLASDAEVAGFFLKPVEPARIAETIRALRTR